MNDLDLCLEVVSGYVGHFASHSLLNISETARSLVPKDHQ